MTVTDTATGLMWSKEDSAAGMTWQDALAWVQAKNTGNYLGHNDWRLPNAKELHSLVNYANAPDFNGKPAIDTAFFTCTGITNENGDADYPYYWASTTHAGYSATGSAGGYAVYIPFGRALGWPDRANAWVDVHGAGCQRSDPKTGPPYADATTHVVTKNGVTYTGYAHGPQGDALRGLNFVRLVRDIGGCSATINGNSLLHIPYLSYVDTISGALSFWADFLYEFNEAYPASILFKLTNAGIRNQFFLFMRSLNTIQGFEFSYSGSSISGWNYAFMGRFRVLRGYFHRGQSLLSGYRLWRYFRLITFEQVTL